MTRLFLLIVVPFFCIGISLSQSNLNLSFENPTTNMPSIWETKSSENYSYKIDNSIAFCGRNSLQFKGIDHVIDTTQKYDFIASGLLLPLDKVKGKKVQIKAMSKINNVQLDTAIYISVMKNETTSAYDNSSQKRKGCSFNGTHNWTQLEAGVDVDKYADLVSIGVFLAGAGTVNIDCFEVYIDGVLLK